MALLLTMASASAQGAEWCGEEAAAAQRAPGAKLQLAVGFEARHAWISAQYRQLGIRKQTSREPAQTTIDLRYGADAVRVTLSANEIIVSRGRQSITVDSPAALGAVQDLLGASPAVFAARATLSELEEEGDLQAPDMSLLSSLAFVASLVGDVNAPRRLADRFVAKHRGIVRPVRWETCWEEYSRESTAAWNDLQACMDEANQDESFLRAAYRRLACNAIWTLRSEAAWFEFLGCTAPIKTVK